MDADDGQSESLCFLCIQFPVRADRIVFSRVISADRVCWFVVSQCESVSINSLAWLLKATLIHTTSRNRSIYNKTSFENQAPSVMSCDRETSRFCASSV